MAEAERLLAPAARGNYPFSVMGQPATPRDFELYSVQGDGPATLDRAGLIRELGASVKALGTILSTEFQVTAIEAADTAGVVRADVRFDVVGTSAAAWRTEQVGTWVMRWRQAPGGWQVVEWTRATRRRAARAPADLHRDHEPRQSARPRRSAVSSTRRSTRGRRPSTRC